MNLQSIIIEQQRIRSVWQEARKVYEESERLWKARLADLDAAEKLLLAGLDLDRIERAKRVLAVSGEVSKPWAGRADDPKARAKLVEEARIDLACGGERLLEGYLGVKNYEAFGDQRSDHAYGYGPRHGSIVFSVGLAREVRERRTLDADEIDAAIYFLSILPKIEATLAEPKQ